MTLSKYRAILDAKYESITQKYAELKQTEADLRKEVERLDKIFAGQCKQLDEAGFEADNGLIFCVFMSGRLLKNEEKKLAANRNAQILTGTEQLIVNIPTRALHIVSRVTGATP